MNFPIKRITVIGLGYIGLPTAAVLAGSGLQVVGVDINANTVEIINRGDIHIIEPGLDALVRQVVTERTLKAAVIPEPADAFLIAVPTPFKGAHEPDLAYVEAAANSIAPFLEKGNIVVLESTCPVGSTEQMTRWLAAARPDLLFPIEGGLNEDISIAYCPERVLPGKVLAELVSNDRVIGGVTPRCSERVASLYRKFVKGDCVITNARTAEMCKLTENSFRDVNIAFANELSLICDKLGINVWELVQLANRHPRVNILNPGPGVGGHCIAVDPWFIVNSAPELAKIIACARTVNDSKPQYVVDKIKDAAKTFEAPKIACLGLAFKGDIDDLRESPAVHIADMLAKIDGFQLLLVEPFITELPSKFSGADNILLVDIEQALQDADIVVGLVDHTLFKQIDLERLKNKIVIDTRGIWG